MRHASSTSLSDEEILKKLQDGDLRMPSLEEELGDLDRAVRIRRTFVSSKVLDTNVFDEGDGESSPLAEVPFEHFDYNPVQGACAENVVGYVPIPVGIAGPLNLNGEEVYVPMATTEGCLIASTHRGAKAISMSGGAHASVLASGMTRAPLVRFPTARRAVEFKRWTEKADHFYQVSSAFNSTSRFARLSNVRVTVAGRSCYVRFKSTTGDAMGMNMVSKGVERALEVLHDHFPDMQVMSLSSNYCTDKKSAAINWIDGRGKSVVAESVIRGDVVKKVLKTTVKDLVDLNIQKNLVGSAVAGALGGFNAHASNVVTAVFIATGQDPAQNVESSNCITLMEPTNEGKDLFLSVTMPSIEVGTVGGGTHLPAQASLLRLMGIRGSSLESPGAHAEQLGRVVASSVMAGELSLMSALAAGHLVRSHMKHNRRAAVEDASQDEAYTKHALPHE